MKLLAFFFVTIGLAACNGYGSRARAPDGAPTPNAIIHPIEAYEEISPEKLLALGIKAQTIEMGDGEYGIYITRDEKLDEAVAAKKVSINFSVWDIGGRFVMAMPSIADDAGPFVLSQGYQIRIALIPISTYADLKLGVGYFCMLNPLKSQGLAPSSNTVH